MDNMRVAGWLTGIVLATSGWATAAAQAGPALPGSATAPGPASSPAGIYDPLGAAPLGAASATSGGALLAQPAMSPGALQLMDLDRRFSEAVAEGGGKAFATWMADDAVALSNGKPPKLGRTAIAADARWDPAVYQLTWTPTGAQMGASNDMGFTWGRYQGQSRDANGQPVTVSGRYITVWKRAPGGDWKVALEASADEPPAAGDCCALPKP